MRLLLLLLMALSVSATGVRDRPSTPSSVERLSEKRRGNWETARRFYVRAFGSAAWNKYSDQKAPDLALNDVLDQISRARDLALRNAPSIAPVSALTADLRRFRFSAPADMEFGLQDLESIETLHSDAIPIIVLSKFTAFRSRVSQKHMVQIEEVVKSILPSRELQRERGFDSWSPVINRIANFLNSRITPDILQDFSLADISPHRPQFIPMDRARLMIIEYLTSWRLFCAENGPDDLHDINLALVAAIRYIIHISTLDKQSFNLESMAASVDRRLAGMRQRGKRLRFLRNTIDEIHVIFSLL